MGLDILNPVYRLVAPSADPEYSSLTIQISKDFHWTTMLLRWWRQFRLMMGLIMLTPSIPKLEETDSSGMKGLFIVTAFQGSSSLLLNEFYVMFCLSAGSVLAKWPV